MIGSSARGTGTREARSHQVACASGQFDRTIGDFQMDLGPTQSIKGGDVKLLRNLVILLGLSVTFLAAVLAFHASSHAPTQLTMSKP
jgi:hypothetical protein